MIWKTTLAGLVIASLAGEASAQEQAKLDCNGLIYGMSATLSGTRQFQQTSPLGDGYVRFSGLVEAGGMIGSIMWGGYTATAPFDGVLDSPIGRQSIAVLDNTDGKMLIYDGQPTTGPPNTIGEFVCNWS